MNGAPLAAWAIALALISPLVYATTELAVAAGRGEPWSVDPDVTERLDAFFAVPMPPGTRRGVMLGISGGLCTFAGAPVDGPVRVLPIAAVGQGFHELYPYVDDVIAHRPDFILIQGTTFVTTLTPPTAYQVARRRVKRRLLSAIGREIDELDPSARAGADREACRAFARPRDEWADELDFDIGWVSRELSSEAHRQLGAALDTLIASGIPLFVFEQPANEFSATYHAILAKRVDALLATLGDRRQHLTVLSQGGLMPSTQFYEANHLTPDGAAAFRARLLDDVTSALDAGVAAR